MAFGFQMGFRGLTNQSTAWTARTKTRTSATTTETSSHQKLTLPFTKVSSCLSLVLLICFQTVLMSTVSNRNAKSFYVYWNTTNPIFRIDNTDHIIDVNKGNVPFEYDQVNIICPIYSPGNHEEDAEKYIIYNVSKEEYETCRITNPNPRIIAVCDKPYRVMYFTITFRSFTPQPGGLEFKPGHDYYFISTSSKDDLHRRIGGRCSTHNMKVVFKVCCHNNTIFNRLPGTTANTTTSATSATTSTTTTTTTTTILPTTVKQISYLSNHNVKSTTKKTNEYEKHPNEVLKIEELTSNGVRGINSGTHCWLLLLLTLTVRLVGR